MDHYDDEVGYCRPPKKHRFKKGQSGNPKGRPPKPRTQLSIDDAEILRRLDAEVILVGRERISRRTAEIRRIFVQAVRGDRKAIRLFEQLMKSLPRHSAGGVLEVPWEHFMRKPR